MKSRRETHPYGEYLSKKTQSLIIGSFPIGKFTDPKRRSEIKDHEIDFYYGGEGNHLWKLLGKVYQTNLSNKEEIVQFLEKNAISMADVIKSCRRQKGSGNDADLYDIEWNTGLHDFIVNNHFKKIYFTSKKVYHWYIKHIGRVEGPEEIVLLSPSANGVRAIPKMAGYQAWLNEIDESLDKKTLLYREWFYKNAFKGKK